MNRSPNFFLIGAPRAGTTALWNYLSQHPDIFLSPVKEPHFFARQDLDGGFRGPYDAAIRSLTVSDPALYQDLFQGAGEETAVGEASTSYLYSNRACDNLKQLPDCKLVAILRNPVDRAYSQFCFNISRGWEPLRDFEEAINHEDERIDQGWSRPFHYVRQGYYARHLERYGDWLAAGRLLVLFHDDFLQDPWGILSTVFEFLGVDRNFSPDASQPHNVSPDAGGSKVLDALLTRQSGLFALKSLVPEQARAKLRRYLWLANRRRPAVPRALRQELAARFESDICKLESLLARDLSTWRPLATK